MDNITEKLNREIEEFVKNCDQQDGLGLTKEATEELLGWLRDFIPLVRQLQTELDKHRWIPADEPPENLRDAPAEITWKTWYETLDYDSTIPTIQQAEQIWLNEGSEVEYYRPITLPTEK